MDDIDIRGQFTIPAAELDVTFSTSGGPGGQHANTSQTRVTLRWDVRASGAVGADVQSRLLAALGDVVSVTVDESRSQWRNRQLARRRLQDRVAQALQPERARIPTRPSRSSQRKRVEDKRRRSEVKRLRKPPPLP